MPSHPRCWILLAALLAGAVAPSSAADSLGVDVTVTLVPSGAPSVTVLPAGPLLVSEAGVQALIQVSLDTAPDQAFTIDVASSLPGEVSVSTSSLAFSPADWSPRTIVVTGLDDTAVDGNRSATIVLAPIAGASSYAGIDPADVQVVNLDDEVPAVVLVESGGSTAVVENGAGDTWTVALAAQPSGPVTVTLLPDSQLAVSAISLSFTTLDWSVPKAVTVDAIDDSRAQGPRTAIVGHRASGGGYDIASRVDLTIAIADDDVAGLVLSPASVLVSETGTSAPVSVTLRSRPDADVVLTAASSDVGEAVVAPASVTITPATWDVPRTFTITGIDDALTDGSQPFTVTVTPTGDAVYAALAASTVAGVCQDDDSASVLLRQSGALAVTEGGGTTAAYAVRLSQQPTAAVTVAIAPDAQVQATPGALTFTALTWNIEQTVAVGAVDDDVAEGAHTGTIAHTWSSADAAYNSLAAQVLSVAVADNDAAGLDVQPVAGLVTTETGGAATFTVRLRSRPLATVTVPIASSDPGQGTVSPASLAFDATSWNVAQTVTITGADGNGRDDGDVVYLVASGPVVSADPAYAGATGTPVQVVNRAVDHPPTIAAIADVTVAEDAGPVAVALAGIGVGQPGEAQVATVTATTSAPGVSGVPLTVYTDPAATGTVTLTPPADASGTATISVTVGDGVSSVTRQFAFTVTPVNDAPVVVRTTALVVGYHGSGEVAPLAVDAAAPGQLAASDVETATAALVVRVLLAPNLGELRRRDPISGGLTVLAADDIFTLADVAAGRISYLHTAVGPATDDAVQFRIEDGSGGTALGTFAIRIDAAIPAIDLLPAGTIAFTEDGSPVAIAALARVTDQDSTDFGTGALTIAHQAGGEAGDGLDVADIGTGAGQIGRSGNQVSYGGTVIGTVAGGTWPNPLVVSLNGNATPAATQELLRQVVFAHATDAPSAIPRTLRVSLRDDLGHVSTPLDREVQVVPVNDPPTLACAPVITYGGVDTTGQAVVTDPDGPLITVAVTVAPLFGSFTAFNGATGAFTYRAAPGYAGPDQFTLIVDDGLVQSAPLTVPIAVTGIATAGRIWFASDPPFEEQAGNLLQWTARIDVADVVGVPDLEWRLVGAPAGMVVVPDPATHTAVLSWPVPANASGHVQFQVLAIERAGQTAAAQHAVVFIHPQPGAAQ